MTLKAALLVVLILAFTSCGNDKPCELVAIRVTPATATANHLAAAPNDQVTFAANGDYQGSCTLPACIDCLPGVTWSVSEPANVLLTPSPSGASTVVAACVNATSGPVTVTAMVTDSTSGQVVTGTASLTCQ